MKRAARRAKSLDTAELMESLESHHVRDGFELLLKLCEKFKLPLTSDERAKLYVAFQQGFRFGVAKAANYIRPTPVASAN